MKRILIIDDEPEILRHVKKRLEANGFACTASLDPVEGLKEARTEKPNLILLDLMLPHMSGLGVLGEIKKDPALAKIPVVILTALGDEEVAMSAMDAGAVGFLNKSCSPLELVTMVQMYA